ncbi:MAG: GlsB/YeaQ/YmgE family stress response membrane protein [Polyangiaceae bacterium]|nr:GlsB/YeaQ/YmgE family stress response membrane protein [Polyangiaceae bacterium]MCW5791257.1 GlsB/YeaQ/YmgE family stress response membrane protein [Polyangiaceae bacterium]
MSLLVFLVFGFIVGLIARALMPGKQPMGCLLTTGLGVVGSFVGGALASLVSGGPLLEIRTSGFIGSVIGAVVVLAVFGMLRSRK